MMKRTVLAMVIVAVVGTVGAQEFNLPPGKWWENERLAERLELTEAQRERIRALVYEHAHRMIDLNANIKKAELELASLAADPEFEAGPARAAFGRFQEARRALETERFEMLLAVREVLTTGQWVEIQEIRRQFRRDNPSPEGPRRRGPPASGPPG